MIHRSQRNNPQVSSTQAGGKHPPHDFSLHRPSPQWVRNPRRTHSRRALTLRPAGKHCRFLGKTHTARAARPEPTEKRKALPRKQNQHFGRATFTASCGAKPRLALVLSTNQSMHSPLGEADTQPHDKQKTKTPTRKHPKPRSVTQPWAFSNSNTVFLQRVSHTQYHVILLSTDKNSWPQKAPSALQNGKPQTRTWVSQISHSLKKKQ